MLTTSMLGLPSTRSTLRLTGTTLRYEEGAIEVMVASECSKQKTCKESRVRQVSAASGLRSGSADDVFGTPAVTPLSLSQPGSPTSHPAAGATLDAILPTVSWWMSSAKSRKCPTWSTGQSCTQRNGEWRRGFTAVSSCCAAGTPDHLPVIFITFHATRQQIWSKIWIHSLPQVLSSSACPSLAARPAAQR